MTPTLNRRGWLAGAAAATAAATLPAGALAQGTAAKAASGRPHRIYAITFRGNTEVERGFEAYFAAHKIPVQITYRDLNRDPTRMAAFLDEIRASRPDLVYTWGTSVTLGVVGPYDGVVAGQHIDNIPVVFTMVASPVLARIVPAAAGAARRNLTGVTHVAPTDAQMRAISAYRPFNTLGVLYTSTERNSVVVLDEIRKIGREKGFRTVERTFKLDGARKPTAEGAADLVRELKEAGAQWLYLPPDSYLGTQAEAVVIPAAMAAGLPTFASTEQLMQAGALSGLVSRYQDIGQFTAHKVEQILVDKQAASAVPIETLKRFSYQIRMPAAQRLQLLPPLAMMSYAEIINSEAAPS
jgi:putative ABC transport system substrate-binding protein